MTALITVEERLLNQRTLIETPFSTTRIDHIFSYEIAGDDTDRTTTLNYDSVAHPHQFLRNVAESLGVDEDALWVKDWTISANGETMVCLIFDCEPEEFESQLATFDQRVYDFCKRINQPLPLWLDFSEVTATDGDRKQRRRMRKAVAGQIKAKRKLERCLKCSA